MESNTERYQPSCLLAHDLVNRLSVIIGHCDLLEEETEEDSGCAKRLRLIKEIARSIAKELNQHQCALDGVLRSGVVKQTRRPTPGAKQ